MTPITFLGKRYYIVHNVVEDGGIFHCGGCVFKDEDSDKCPNGCSGSPLKGQCSNTNRIYIHRTKKALAEWVAWKMDGWKEQE